MKKSGACNNLSRNKEHQTIRLIKKKVNSWISYEINSKKSLILNCKISREVCKTKMSCSTLS